jgi:hypothetical protein
MAFEAVSSGVKQEKHEPDNSAPSTCQSALQPWVSLDLLYNQPSLLPIPHLPFPSSLFSIFFKSLSTSSNYLILRLPFLHLEYSLPFNILFGISLSSILSTCPSAPSSNELSMVELHLYSPIRLHGNKWKCLSLSLPILDQCNI